MLHQFVERKLALGEAISLERIYVENVRAFFGFSHSVALLLLETAVREGEIERRVALLCPYGHHIIKSVSSSEAVPDCLLCQSCEAEGREGMHSRNELEEMTFYRLVKTVDG